MSIVSVLAPLVIWWLLTSSAAVVVLVTIYAAERGGWSRDRGGPAAHGERSDCSATGPTSRAT